MNRHLRSQTLASDQQLSIEEFLEFTARRPAGERWEFIEGKAVMNPSPVRLHQLIAGNILEWLLKRKVENNETWLPLLGVGTVVPIAPRSLPQPDVYVQAAGIADDQPYTDDAVVVFEGLCRGNSKADRAWRRRAYASVPNCQHYVTVAQKAARVVVFDRSTGWAERELKNVGDTLVLDAIGASIPLSVIYRWTPVSEGKVGHKRRRGPAPK